MSDPPATANPKPAAEKAGAETPPTRPLPSVKIATEPLENQPLQLEPVGAELPEIQPLTSAETATEPIKNTSDNKQSESEQPAVKQSKTRLEKLLEERQAIDKRIKQALEKEAQEKRQRETRQKILIGAAMQKQISKGTLTQDWLLAVLDAELTLERDRKLFDLPPLPETMAPTKGAG